MQMKISKTLSNSMKPFFVFFLTALLREPLAAHYTLERFHVEVNTLNVSLEVSAAYFVTVGTRSSRSAHVAHVT